MCLYFYNLLKKKYESELIKYFMIYSHNTILIIIIPFILFLKKFNNN